MLDINLFRTDKGSDLDVVRDSQRKRYADVALVDQVAQLDQQWRQEQYQFEQLKREFNALNKEIASRKKAKQDANDLQQKSKELKGKIEEVEEKSRETQRERDKVLCSIGNLLHDSVPLSSDEADNVVLREVGGQPSEPGLRSHYDLVQMLGLVNLEAGQAVAGARGYYLINEGVMLNQALIMYALQFLAARGYTPIHTPFMMTREVMAECAQLSQFDDELYRVVGGESDDKYLIATSEQTLCALHRKGWLEPSQLPLRYAGYSTCFRREAGSHGKDTLGIFRVHQFEKVEQFVLAAPDDGSSWRAFDDMIKTAEEFYHSLGIPYRLVNLVSGALNNAAAKKVDLEAWFPSSRTYRELVSCSNCTDYQARRLDIRLRLPTAKPGASNGEQQQQQQSSNSTYVHMLNCTLTATQRTLCSILENHQTSEGVKVPAVLQPFMMGCTFIPFRNMLDKAGRLVTKAAKHIK